MDRLEAKVRVTRTFRQFLRGAASQGGGLLLIAILSVSYWIPIGIWLAKTLLTEGNRLPHGFPFVSIALRTAVLSAIVAVGSTILAYPIALLWRLLKPTRQAIIGFLMVVPMIMGALARNYSWRGMLASRDPVSSLGWSWLGGPHLQYTAFSVEAVMVCIFIPVAFFLLVQGGAAATQRQVFAARTMGASENIIVWSVICPCMNRAAILSIGLVFSMASGYFITPQMIGGSKLSFVGNAVYTFVNIGQFGVAAVIGVRFVLIMLIPIIFVMVMSLRRRFLVTGR